MTGEADPAVAKNADMLFAVSRENMRKALGNGSIKKAFGGDLECRGSWFSRRCSYP